MNDRSYVVVVPRGFNHNLFLEKYYDYFCEISNEYNVNYTLDQIKNYFSYIMEQRKDAILYDCFSRLFRRLDLIVMSFTNSTVQGIIIFDLVTIENSVKKFEVKNLEENLFNLIGR